MPPPQKARPTKPRGDPENTIKLFASSKRGPEIKLKSKAQSKPEGRLKFSPGGPSLSQSPVKGTLEEATELSDSEVDAPRNPASGSKPLIDQSRESTHEDRDSNTPSDAPYVRSLTSAQKGRADSEMDVETESIKSTPARKNTARCSRGKKAIKLKPSVSHEEYEDRRASSFKSGMPSTKASASDAEGLSIKSNGQGQEGKNGIQDDDTSDEDYVPGTPEDTHMTSDAFDTFGDEDVNGTAVFSPKRGKAKGIITDESDAEEFHELSDFRRSLSPQTNPTSVASVKAKLQKIPVSNVVDSSEDTMMKKTPLSKKRKVDALSRDTTPRAASLAASSDYISREEFDIIIKRLKEDFKEEMEKMQTSMRLDTKRLIRSEVKDEILLAQPHS